MRLRQCALFQTTAYTVPKEIPPQLSPLILPNHEQLQSSRFMPNCIDTKASWRTIRTLGSEECEPNENMYSFFGPSLRLFLFPIFFILLLLGCRLPPPSPSLASIFDGYQSIYCSPSPCSAFLIFEKTSCIPTKSNLPLPLPRHVLVAPMLSPSFCGQYYHLSIYIQTKSQSISE